MKKLPATDAIFARLAQVNPAADADPTVLRMSVDARTVPEGTTLLVLEARRDPKLNAHFIAFHASGACDHAAIELERGDREATTIETKGKLGQFEVTER